MTLMRLLLLIALALVAAFNSLAQAVRTVAALPPEREVATHYLDGMDALESGEFKRAVASFTQAIGADDRNADYLRARGVAHTLAENFPAAIGDLQRSLKLRSEDREARLWLAAAYRMSGDAATGAQYFTQGGDLPADYASLVYNDMAMEYLSSKRGFYYDRETRKTVQVADLIKRRFPDAARAYVSRHAATGRVPSAAVMTRMKTSMEQSDWAAAMKDLQLLRRTAPDDPALRGYWAKCLLGLGNAAKAREEFTRVLCAKPLWAEGYLGRAEAAAILGDRRRANADLETAASLGAKIDAAKAKIAKTLSAQRVPDDATARFTKSVEADAASEALVEAALSVHLWFNARRLRYDEAYQDRVWVLSDAIRAESKSAGRHEALGRFLYNHYVVPETWNGPRGGGEQLRPQSEGERKMELQRALESSDAALKLDARHANALATKGWILYQMGRSSEVEGLVNRGLDVERKNVRLLNLKSQLLIDTAVALTTQVTALRAGRTETSTERRADGVYEARKHYPATAEQLAQAAALEAQAIAFRRQAEQLGREAAEVRARIIPELMKDSDNALARGDAKTARRLLEQGYSYDPDLPDLHRRLADVCQKLGDTRSQRVFALLAEPMRHTTAAEPLKLAWENAARTDWRSAAEALDRAGGLNPADARVLGYRSVIAAQRLDANNAERQRRAALALEEARARLMGNSFLKTNGVPIELGDAGLTLILRLHQGNALLAAGQNDKAIEAFAINLELEKRVPKEHLVELVPSAMLPDPTLDSATVPEAPTLASLVAWSRLGTARALLALGRPAEAEPQYRAVRSYLINWPKTAKNRETMNVVDSWARLGLAEAAYGSKDYDTAFKLLMSGEGWPWRLPQDLEKQRAALSEKVVAARKGNWEEETSSRQTQWRKQSQISALQREIKALETQRDGMQTTVNRPGLRSTAKEQLDRNLAELERRIAEKKQTLTALEEAPARIK